MCTIKLYDVMEGKDFPMAGSSLYDIIRENMNSSDKIWKVCLLCLLCF